MAKGIDATATSAMADGKARAQQAEIVARIVKVYEGQGIPIGKIVQLKAVLMGIQTSGGNLAPLEDRIAKERLAIDPLLVQAEAYRKTLRPPIPRAAPSAAPPRPKEPEIVPCHRCGKNVTVGDTACVSCRIPLVWRGNVNRALGTP